MKIGLIPFETECNCERCRRVREDEAEDCRIYVEAMTRKPKTPIEAYYQKKAWDDLLAPAFAARFADAKGSGGVVKFHRVRRE